MAAGRANVACGLPLALSGRDDLARASSSKKTKTSKRMTNGGLKKKTAVSSKLARKKPLSPKPSAKTKAIHVVTKPGRDAEKTVPRGVPLKLAAVKAVVPPVTAKPKADPGNGVDEPRPRPSVEEAMATLSYKEGQYIVHPKYGLGKIERIQDRKLTTRTVPCLEITFPYQDMKLTIPVDQVDRSGLREPIGRKEIDGIFKVLRGRATFDTKRRSAKRVADYRRRLNLGDPHSLAEAVRDLGRLSLRKSLSYEERKLLSMALRILSREVALARGRDSETVREEIEKIVYR